MSMVRWGIFGTRTLAAWVRRRVVLASPYCWLWEDSTVGKAYCKRNILFPSMVIMGREIHEAKRYGKRTRDKRALRQIAPSPFVQLWPYKLGSRVIRVRIPWLVLA